MNAIIKDFPNYEVDTDGNVYRLKTKKTNKRRKLTGTKNQGYTLVTLTESGKHKACRVHRLVAEAFIPNLKNKPQVNHKDGNRSNNELSNLEWCTASENLIHSYVVLKRKGVPSLMGRTGSSSPASQGVAQYSKDMKLIEEFETVEEALTKFGKSKNHGGITNACTGYANTAFGFIWKRI